MSTEQNNITVSGLRVEIVRKNIKNLHLGVYPPAGRVRVAAPLRVGNDAVRLAVIGKLGWIKRQQAKFDRQPRESEREMVSGESHYFLGHRHRLHVVSTDKSAGIALRNRSILELRVRPGTTAEGRRRILMDWYREQLKQLVPDLLAKWQKRLGLEAPAWGIRRMKTKWGTCNAEAHRIWVNLELAKKSVDCIEYVVMHELVHLIVRHHDDQFVGIMDKHLPRWRSLREELNCLPLAHEAWRE
jgi:predicted metal-dependent hydrolase